MNNQNEKLSGRILRDLQEIKVELRGARGLRGEIGTRFDALDLRVDGLSHLVTLMAGHAQRVDDRLARVEDDAAAQGRPAPGRSRDSVMRMLQRGSD